MRQVLDPRPHSFAGVEQDRLARLYRGIVMLIMKAQHWLLVYCCWFPQDDVWGSRRGVWAGIVAVTEVNSTPTILEFWGRGSGGESGQAGA